MSQLAIAQEMEFITDEDILKNAVAARTTRGIVESVNLEARSAVISGYAYDFGTPDMPVPVEVKMYNSDYGAFELLERGMKVEVVYGDTGDLRLVVRLQQLSNDAVIEDF